MKISDNKKRQAELNFDAIVKDLIAEHGTIFFASIDDYNFIYKPLSRKDYRAIVESVELNDFEKEDEVCAITVLWPYDIDWDEIEAGIPNKLYREILTNSFLDSPESVSHLINIYRQELETIDMQMSCIISEAFPNYDIEEIESWDMIKFCKIFSRAEWKLKNLRQLDGIKDVTEFLITEDDDSNNDSEEDIQENTIQQPIQKTSTVKVGNKEMTADEYRQYQEMQRMFPDIAWEADTMFTGFDTQTIDTTPVAQRAYK